MGDAIQPSHLRSIGPDQLSPHISPAWKQLWGDCPKWWVKIHSRSQFPLDLPPDKGRQSRCQSLESLSSFLCSRAPSPSHLLWASIFLVSDSPSAGRSLNIHFPDLGCSDLHPPWEKASFWELTLIPLFKVEVLPFIPKCTSLHFPFQSSRQPCQGANVSHAASRGAGKTNIP